MGKFLNLLEKDSKCCSVRTVLGLKIMVCLSDRAEINDALIAISVLPKPTSPHNNLFIGLINERSFLISLETIS